MRSQDKIDLNPKLVIAADSKSMVYEERGLTENTVDERLANGQPLDLDKITSIMQVCVFACLHHPSWCGWMSA